MPQSEVQSTSETLDRLTMTIMERRAATAEKSYTKSLLDAGPHRCAKKFGEEAVEFALAVAGEDDGSVSAEAADVIYHLLVALESRNVALSDVMRNLEARMGMSGHDEKASR